MKDHYNVLFLCTGNSAFGGARSGRQLHLCCMLFTASTSFANPAVTVPRSITDTFSWIRPRDVPGFVLPQAAGATTATLLFHRLDRNS